MELRDYLKVIRRHVWLMVSIVLVALAAFLVVSFLRPPTYQGEAQVIVSGQNPAAIVLGAPQNQASTLAEQAYVLTQARVIQSRGLAEQVILTLGLKTTPDSLLKRVTASTDGQTDIVTVDAMDGSAVRAAELANAFVDAYVAWSRGRQISSIKAAADDVEQRLAQAQQQIVALTPAAGQAVPGGQQVRLQAVRALYAALADKLEQLRINQQLATGSGSVLSSATVDPVRISPNHAADAGLGLAVGLLASLGVVFLVEQLDTRIRSSDEAEEMYHAPLLGSIPLEKHKRRDSPSLTLVESPDSPEAEAYRALRNNVDFSNVEHDIRTVLVTSAAPKEGKSTVAGNLAVALSQAGQTVVLVDCDFRRPTVATLFGVHNGIGLSDVLVGKQDIRAALQQPEGFGSLSLVAAGSIPPNPSELLASTAMGTLISSLANWDWIILDLPPLLAVADTAAAARWADAALVVARLGVSTRPAAEKSRDQLEKVGTRLLGVVLLGAKESVAAGYGYSGYISR